MVGELATLLPDEPLAGELSTRLSTTRAARLRRDLDVVRQQVQHYMAMSAWRQAEEVAAELVARYPGAQEAQSLLDDVQREKIRFETDHIQRPGVGTGKRSPDQRQWRRAVELVEEIIGRYPNEVRAEMLRLDLPTLRENAEAQERAR